MDKELLKEYNLENVQKRFQQLCEYTFITKPTLSEDDDENGEQEAQQGQDQGQQQGIPQPTDGGTSNVQNMPPQEVQNGNDQMDGMNNQQQEMPQEPMDGEVEQNGIETSPMEADDEVIDVDDLTQSQEETEYKVDGVDDKLVKLLKVTDKFLAALEQNDRKIEDLKAEIEKRNPTEEEKLNLRSQASYPYSERPKDFWDNKMKNSNYNVIYNNDVPTSKEQEEYVLTKDDLNGMNDRDIAKSFDPSKLSDYFDY